MNDSSGRYGWSRGSGTVVESRQGACHASYSVGSGTRPHPERPRRRAGGGGCSKLVHQRHRRARHPPTARAPPAGGGLGATARQSGCPRLHGHSPARSVGANDRWRRGLVLCYRWTRTHPHSAEQQHGHCKTRSPTTGCGPPGILHAPLPPADLLMRYPSHGIVGPASPLITRHPAGSLGVVSWKVRIAFV